MPPKKRGDLSTHERKQQRKEQRKLHRKLLKGKKSAQEPAQKKKKVDEEITSDEDEDISDIIANAKTDNDTEMYEKEEETPNEIKCRLAAEYLNSLKKYKDEDSEINTDILIAQRLKEDVLEAAGQLRKPFAEVVRKVDDCNVKYLHCKWQDKSLTCVVYSKNFIFTSSKNGSIVKWSFSQKEAVIKNNVKNNSEPGHKSIIFSLAVSSDGKYLASGDFDGYINIWNAETLDHLKKFESHKKAVSGLSFRRDTHTLFSCSHDRLVRMWNIDILALVENCGGHEDKITALDCYTKESCITSGGIDRNIVINMFQEDKQLIYNSKHTSVDGVKLLNEKTFITFGQEGSICLWITSKKKPMHVVQAAHGMDEYGIPNWITSVATLINTDLFASGSMDNFVRLWKADLSTNKMEVIKKIEIPGVINCLEFTPSGSHLLAAVGKEHKLGRWFKFNVKNNLAIIDLNTSEK